MLTELSIDDHLIIWSAELDYWPILLISAFVIRYLYLLFWICICYFVFVYQQSIDDHLIIWSAELDYWPISYWFLHLSFGICFTNNNCICYFVFVYQQSQFYLFLHLPFRTFFFLKLPLWLFDYMVDYWSYKQYNIANPHSTPCPEK